MSGDKQIEVRAAWLDFVEGMTQAEIARAAWHYTVADRSHLVDSRRNGLVSIAINSEFASCVALEQEMIRDFKLKDAVIVPTPVDQTQVPLVLGQATAEYVSRFLENNRIRGFGIGWDNPPRNASASTRGPLS